MKTKLACLTLATFVFASCDKSETAAKPDDASSKKPQTENRTAAPAIAEKPAPARPDTPAPNIIDPPLSHPVTAEMIKPAGTAPDDTSWETLTAEQKIEKFNAKGITRMPKDVSDKLLANATSAGTAEIQVQFITQQAAAWHQINEFKLGVNDIPEHMRMSLLEKLSAKHGNSWRDMVPELEEQMAASRKVMDLRLNGIPGMSADESQDLFIKAMEQYGSDYKTILSVAEQNAKK